MFSYSGELIKVLREILLGILVILLAGFPTDMIIITLLLMFFTSSVKFKTYESVIFIFKAMLYERKHNFYIV